MTKRPERKLQRRAHRLERRRAEGVAKAEYRARFGSEELGLGYVKGYYWSWRVADSEETRRTTWQKSFEAFDETGETFEKMQAMIDEARERERKRKSESDEIADPQSSTSGAIVPCIAPPMTSS